MHTPEQASALWCPMVRAARREIVEHHTGYKESTWSEIAVIPGCNTDALGGNRIPDSCRCIADRCAMWRWELPDRRIMAHPGVTPADGSTPPRPEGVPDHWVFEAVGAYTFWAEPLADALARRTGYCGLSSKPSVLHPYRSGT